MCFARASLKLVQVNLADDIQGLIRAGIFSQAEIIATAAESRAKEQRVIFKTRILITSNQLPLG